MNRNSRNLGTYLMIAAVVVLIFLVFRNGFTPREAYSYSEYVKAVEAEMVTRVDVHQNAQVPTGRLLVYMKDGSVKTVNVSDVKEEQDWLEEQDIPYYTYDIERESVFLTTVVPMLLMGLLFVAMFAFMNRQASGGSNNKMMNF
ncbi:MAG TPA: ATP-dependent metallopeptidase FtsH/Yme1/Tma family protein, partial [Candidatus Limivivens intestinipullorum]|nr:ATP-dependent metallopeptidase FtsH/Yme1/Tma family protein [Candidatus Limivivens intestinipullorum]